MHASRRNTTTRQPHLDSSQRPGQSQPRCNALGLDNLLRCHLGVASELANLDAAGLEAHGEVADNLLNESLHKSNADNLKSVEVDGAVGVEVL